MLTTAEQICNVALARVGQRQMIDSLSEASAQAQLCQALYAPARDAVLEEFAWPFATRRAVLALTPLKRTGWAFVYDLPSDCLAPRRIIPPIRSEAREQQIAWALEDDSTYGRVLLTDWSDAELEYTRAEETVALFSPLFCDALAWRLACDLALGLAVKPQLLPTFERKYQLALATAKAAALNERQEDVPPDAEWIRGR